MEKRNGIYHCVACGQALFESETKYESGSGWPSFYKPISDEAVVAAKPDVILAMAHGGPNHVDAAELFALPAFGATPAARNKRFIAIDGLSLLFFGPRTARAARELSIAIHPELAGASAPKPVRDDACR